jgi:hypothetical protein
MMRLPLFRYEAPTTLDEAVRILASGGAEGQLAGRRERISCRT